MADRQDFLAKIQDAAARGRAYRVALNPDATHEQAYVGHGGDPVGSLLREWTAVGGRGHRVQGRSQAQAFLRDFIAQFQVQRAIRWAHPVLDRVGVDETLSAANVNVRVWDELAQQPDDERWEQAFAADLGITSVDYAVAETGSLALCHQPAQGRVVSLLPPVFLAILEPSQIVPDLFDLFAHFEPFKHLLPSNISLVTGPSKTGDIELKLTTGVHGPGEVHLLVVE